MAGKAISVWWAAIAVVSVLLLLSVERFASRNALAEGQDRAETILRQTVNGLEGHLQRFEALPALLARNANIRDAVERPGNLQQIAALNHWLAETNALIEASDLYLIDLTGTTIAASNYDRDDSFVGQNFSYRPYFTAAREGQSGHFFALGTTSGVRGYYFASPVRNSAGKISGVLALKIGVDQIEAGWAAREYRILVTDPDGIVFMSTEKEWLYRAFFPLVPPQMARIEASRRYAAATLRVLQSESTLSGTRQLLRLTDGQGVEREYVGTEHVMPQAGWTVRVLLDTAPLRAQARLLLAAFGLLLAVALLLFWTVQQRRVRLAERLAMQAAAKAGLERQVDERTQDLTRANSDLQRMQSDLVQAGKLAALGRMSAALSHEINQPLAAARNYADSAGLLIDRGDLPRAKENIGHILALVDRMATIARHLRNVARKPNEPLKAVDLGVVVTDALAVVRARVESAGAVVETDFAEGLPLVQGGPVRLQQVIVNVLSNAADSVEGLGDRLITLSGRLVNDEVHLCIRDRGPGVAPAIADRIFDPFFTTKQVGSGLGLGLSISYNIMKDFEGDLRVANHPEGGAVFTIVLRQARSKAMAAE
jgi:two-component system, NtrC family, C4-dicarboxylate transport sensor histidine kinase DctB